MVRRYKLPSCLHKSSKTSNRSKKNVNQILHSIIILNQHLNRCICPFPVHWNQDSETYTISKKLLKIYWTVPVYKFLLTIILTNIAIHGTFNSTQKLPPNFPAIFCISTASHLISITADIFVIHFAADVVKCFGWVNQISHDYFHNHKFGKFIPRSFSFY